MIRVKYSIIFAYKQNNNQQKKSKTQITNIKYTQRNINIQFFLYIQLFLDQSKIYIYNSFNHKNNHTRAKYINKMYSKYNDSEQQTKTNTKRIASQPKNQTKKIQSRFDEHLKSIYSYGKKTKMLKQKNMAVHDWVTSIHLQRQPYILQKLKKIIIEGLKTCKKAIVYTKSKKSATQLNRLLQNQASSMIICPELSSSTQIQSKINQFQNKQKIQVLLTNIQPYNLFQNAMIQIYGLNLIVNQEMPIEPQIYKSRILRTKQLNKDTKGIVVNVVQNKQHNNVYYTVKQQLDHIEKKLGIKSIPYSDNIYLREFITVGPSSPYKNNYLSQKQQKQEQKKVIQKQHKNHYNLKEDKSNNIQAVLTNLFNKNVQIMKSEIKRQISQGNIQIIKQLQKSTQNQFKLQNTIKQLKNQIIAIKKFKDTQKDQLLTKISKKQQQIEKLNKSNKQLQSKLKDYQNLTNKMKDSYQSQLKQRKYKNKQEIEQEYMIQKQNRYSPSLDKTKQRNDKKIINSSVAIKTNQNIDKFIQSLNKAIQRSFKTKFEINPSNYIQKLPELTTLLDSSIYKDVFLNDSVIFQKLQADSRSLLYQSIKRLVHFDIRKTNTLLQISNSKKEKKFDKQWLKKIEGKKNILVLLQVESNGNMIAGFSQSPFKLQNTEQKQNGDAFLLSLTNLKLYELKYKFRGKVFINNSESIIFGNNQFIIQPNYKFKVSFSESQCYFNYENHKVIDLTGQSNNQGSYSRLQVHEILLKTQNI